jgi:hypothetical protein
MLTFDNTKGIDIIVSADICYFREKIIFRLERIAFDNVFSGCFVLRKDEFNLTDEQFDKMGIHLKKMFEELSILQHYSIINHATKIKEEKC